MSFVLKCEKFKFLWKLHKRSALIFMTFRAIFSAKLQF